MSSSPQPPPDRVRWHGVKRQPRKDLESAHTRRIFFFLFSRDNKEQKWTRGFLVHLLWKSSLPLPHGFLIRVCTQAVHACVRLLAHVEPTPSFHSAACTGTSMNWDLACPLKCPSSLASLEIQQQRKEGHVTSKNGWIYFTGKQPKMSKGSQQAWGEERGSWGLADNKKEPERHRNKGRLQ